MKEKQKRIFNTCSDRNAQKISQIIRENVHPGTTIITDQYRTYEAALNNNDFYEHQHVNHSRNFVDLKNASIHTLTIEGLWGHMKRFLRGKNGISKEQQSESLIQFL
ncbi:hypothetical protein DMUE_5395 [Dictyocoela muelleri]|nr:hypothetical protein DMUE_5395 [Dictyocoela muelleri]